MFTAQFYLQLILVAIAIMSCSAFDEPGLLGQVANTVYDTFKPVTTILDHLLSGGVL